MQETYATPTDFLTDLNKERLANPQRWIFFSGNVAGKAVQLKTFGHSYLQIFRIDGMNQRLPGMDCKVSAWKSAIESALMGVN